MQAVEGVPQPVPSRQWLAQHLQQQGFSPGEGGRARWGGRHPGRLAYWLEITGAQ